MPVLKISNNEWHAGYRLNVVYLGESAEVLTLLERYGCL